MSRRGPRVAPVTMPEHVPAGPALPDGPPRSRLLAVAALPLPIPELSRLAQAHPGATIATGPDGALWVRSPGIDCDCLTCFDATAAEYAALTGETLWPRFVVCPVCGCKRCPRATDHALPCTGSNAPGQPGSAYALPTGADQ